jgi:hypothetical protein
LVHRFAETVESRLGIDVIRVPGLSTDYSLRIGEHGVIVLATQSSWFRSNWSLAHELGHLALSHHNSLKSEEKLGRDEQRADQFAAALLLPPEVALRVRDLHDSASTARFVWEVGVSTEAVRYQLSAHDIQVDPTVSAALALSTPRLLRAHVGAVQTRTGVDPIMRREQRSSARRFPVSLLSALQSQIDAGAASPEILAWALDVPVDDLDFPEPIEENAETIAERQLRLRPSTADWSRFISGRVRQGAEGVRQP